MDDTTNARRGNGSAVEIEEPIHLRIGRELGIDARTTKKIQREKSLGQKAIP
jgi:hypothetical protein